LGLLAGSIVAVWHFPGRAAVLVVLNTLLALPSVVVGLVVYLLLSRAGPLGAWGILFTPAAMVIAQSLLVTPIVAALARQVVEDAMRDHGEQLRSLGASRVACALIIAWDERLARVGATGSGKSTLLRAVHGLVPLAGGHRVVDGAPRIAMVFQRPFMLRLTVRANVELGLMLQRMPRAQRRERAMRALERVGLAAEAGRIGRVLSAGQQQRA